MQGVLSVSFCKIDSGATEATAIADLVRGLGNHEKYEKHERIADQV
jgi:hypothetical protein